MKHKVKLLVILMVLSLLLILGWLVYQKLLAGSQSTTSVNSLSPRSQEFISKESSQGTGLWSTVNFSEAENPGTLPANTPILTQCLTFQSASPMLWQSEDSIDGRCTVRLKSLSPFGYLVIARYPAESFVEDTGIALRRSDLTEYQEKVLSFGQFKSSSVFTDSDSVTAFGWDNGTMVTVALTGAQPISEKLTIFVQDILGSVALDASDSTQTASASASP